MQMSLRARAPMLGAFSKCGGIRVIKSPVCFLALPVYLERGSADEQTTVNMTLFRVGSSVHVDPRGVFGMGKFCHQV
jgi:hypothetical protein